MKKYTRIAYIFLILAFLMMAFTIYKVYGQKDDKADIKDKAYAEVKNIESKFLNLFNEINNIKFENYKISSTEIKQENKGNSSSETTSEGKSSSESASKSNGRK